MWCPKCKTEYQDGITQCAECHTPLVEELPVEIDTSPLEEKLNTLHRMDGRENLHRLSDGNKAYVEKSKKYEDMQSTAYSFLLVSVVGVLLLVLVYTGVIPLQFATYMKYMMAIVMGGMFLIFFIIGIRSYRKLGGLKAEVMQEQQDRETAKSWFLGQYSEKAIDLTLDINSSDEVQQKYFLRSQFMKRTLSEKFPAYEDAFLDYLTEQLYEEMYPQD